MSLINNVLRDLDRRHECSMQQRRNPLDYLIPATKVPDASPPRRRWLLVPFVLLGVVLTLQLLNLKDNWQLQASVPPLTLPAAAVRIERIDTTAMPDSGPTQAESVSGPLTTIASAMPAYTEAESVTAPAATDRRAEELFPRPSSKATTGAGQRPTRSDISFWFEQVPGGADSTPATHSRTAGHESPVDREPDYRVAEIVTAASQPDLRTESVRLEREHEPELKSQDIAVSDSVRSQRSEQELSTRLSPLYQSQRYQVNAGAVTLVRQRPGVDVTTSSSTLSDSNDLNWLVSLSSDAESNVSVAELNDVDEPSLDQVVLNEPVSDSELDTTAAPPAVVNKDQAQVTPRPQDPYRQALDVLRSGRQQEAVRLLLALVGSEPMHMEARLLAATTLHELGRAASARAVLEDGLARQPGNSALRSHYAKLLLAANRLEQALQVLKSNSPPMQHEPEYHAFIAALEQRRGNHTAAVAVYEQLLKHQSAQGVWWMGLAISLEASGNAEAAYTAYKTALGSGRLDTKLHSFVETRLGLLSPRVSS